MDVNSIHDTPGPETKDNLLLIAMTVDRISTFWYQFFKPNSYSEEVWKMSKYSELFTGWDP